MSLLLPIVRRFIYPSACSRCFNKRWNPPSCQSWIHNNSHKHPGSSTVDREEILKFQRLSHAWWNEAGEFAVLHRMNSLRVPLVRDTLVQNYQDSPQAESTYPLKGLTILDVGCGGGILTEPLGRLGATVTGLDASEDNIQAATLHAAHEIKTQANINYVCETIENLDVPPFDAVIASEVIEHVNNVNTFIECCCKLVKPGGSIFFTTINKTYISYVVMVLCAETLRIVPPGTHDWDKFVTVENLKQQLVQNEFNVRLVHGITYNPLTRKMSWTSNTDCGYAMYALKTSKDENQTDIGEK